MPYRTPSRDLGPFERELKSPFPAQPILLTLLLLGVPGICLVSGVQSAPGQVFAGDASVNVPIGAALLVFAGVVIRMFLRKATLAIALHSNGLKWTERGLTRVIPWSDIATIDETHTTRTASGVTVARTRVYRIGLTDGTECVVTSMLAGVSELGTRIQKELAARR
ncbi:hypothetical protein BH09MYX1_BH09MYX1_40540 [soil metagenome]